MQYVLCTLLQWRPGFMRLIQLGQGMDPETSRKHGEVGLLDSVHSRDVANIDSKEHQWNKNRD